MLESLKAAPLFKGYRGKAPLDMEALARMVANVSRLAAEKRDEIAELDINPCSSTKKVRESARRMPLPFSKHSILLKTDALSTADRSGSLSAPGQVCPSSGTSLKTIFLSFISSF